MQPKSAEAMKTTEDDKMKELEELFDEPEGRAPAGSLSALWGDPGHKDPTHNGRAAWNEFISDSPKLLSRAFDGFEASAKGDKALMGEYFSTQDYTSRSPLLRKYAEAGHIPAASTLAERVQAVTGRR